MTSGAPEWPWSLKLEGLALKRGEDCLLPLSGDGQCQPVLSASHGPPPDSHPP